MGRCKNLLSRLLGDDAAATAVEYAVLVALIIVVVIVGIWEVSQQTGGMYGTINNSMTGAGA